MPNIVNENGLQIKTLEEMRAELFSKLRSIYGNDIYLGQDSPDAQLAMIYIQASLDVLDKIVEVYNSFDPDKAIGRIQDQRYAINGIQRKGGTYSITPVRIVTSGPVTLYGVDQLAEEVYSVEDDAGNIFDLVETVSLPNAGTFNLIFQSRESGRIEILPNTITSQATIVIEVTSVNNPSPPVVIGMDEESDPEFRLRRQRSTAISSQGYADGLIGALFNVNGVEKARVYENKTSANPDSRDIPSHSIWVIVQGVYSEQEVANAIYRKRNAGAGMKGDKHWDFIDQNGDAFTVQWDDVDVEDLFIEITIDPIDPLRQVNLDLIREKLPEVLSYDINDTANASGISCAVQDIDPNALVTSAGFSYTSMGSFVNKLSNTALNRIFTVNSENIILLPIAISPSSASVIGGATPENRTFTAHGGYGSYTWSIYVDNSGAGGNPATIDSQGNYIPGDANTGVTDTIKVVDEKGNEAFVFVEVTSG